jgi:hypothetical protein
MERTKMQIFEAYVVRFLTLNAEANTVFLPIVNRINFYLNENKGENMTLAAIWGACLFICL